MSETANQKLRKQITLNAANLATAQRIVQNDPVQYPDILSVVNQVIKVHFEDPKIYIDHLHIVSDKPKDTHNCEDYILTANRSTYLDDYGSFCEHWTYTCNECGEIYTEEDLDRIEREKEDKKDAARTINNRPIPLSEM